MKKIKNRMICIIIAVVMSFGLMTPAIAVQSEENQNEIGVMINGEMLTFADAKPVNQNGKIFVPFRDIFEALGASVSFDGDTGTIKAVLGEKSLFLVVGSKEARMVNRGDSRVLTMEIAPYIDQTTGRTLIPARFIAESFGYNVSWDSAKRTVVLIDVDRLTKNLNGEFSVLNLLLEADSQMSKTPMKVTGDVDYQIDIKNTGASPAMEMDMTADISAVEYMNDMDMSMNLSIDFDKMLSNLPESERAMMAPLLKQYESIPVTIKMDGKNGLMYIRSEIFNLSPIPLPDGRTIDGSVWLKMDFNAMSQMAGGNHVPVDYNEFLKNADQYNTVEKILNLLLKSQSSYTVGSYQDIQAGITFAKALLGDGAFVKKPGLTYDTYVLSIGPEEWKAAAAAAYPLASEATRANLSDVMEVLNKTDLVDDFLAIEASYTIENGKVKASAGQALIDFSGLTEGEVPIKFNMQMTQNGPKEQLVTMDMDLADMMTVYMAIHMILEDSPQKPDVSVPSGETVIDYMEMLSLLINMP